jgi:hypothetical protein
MRDTEINDWLTERHIAVFRRLTCLPNAFRNRSGDDAGVEETGGDPQVMILH